MNTLFFPDPGQTLLALLLRPGPLSPLFLIALLPLAAWLALRWPAPPGARQALSRAAITLPQGWRWLLLPALGLFCLALCSLPVLALPFSLLLAWLGLDAGHALRRAVHAQDQLEYAQVAENIVMARAALQKLMPLPMAEASLPELYRLLAAWIMENFLCGLVYPLFWFAMAGAPGLVCALALHYLAADAGRTGRTLYEAALFVPARISAVALWLSYNHQYDPGGAPGGHWPGLGRLAAETRTLSSLAWPLAAASWLHHARSRAGQGSDLWLGPEDLPDEDEHLPHWEAERLRALQEHLPRAVIFCGLLLALLPLFLTLIA